MTRLTAGAFSGLLLAMAFAPLSAQPANHAAATLGAPTSSDISWTVRGSWKGPSGFVGSGIERSHMADNDFAVTSLNFKEKGDDAVWIEVVGRKLCADASCQHATLRTFRIQGQNGNFYSQKGVYAGEERYATAIQICTSGSGKIKGARMWGARVRADLTLQRSNEVDQFTRPNCSSNRWGAKLECTGRQVIVGIRVHGSVQRGYQGLSIRCGEIQA